jgi:hypothetical protein
LIAAGLEPVLHFRLLPGAGPAEGATSQNLRVLFETYAQWGVHYAVLFDRPNVRASWPAQAWVRNNLVERFLDLFLPLAEAASLAGLNPVFPPLEPGGDFWDTAFLRLALQGLQRRSRPALLEKLVLGAYAWTGVHPINWGAGGPERWPSARPYDTPAGSEDQRGFHIFDWYLTIARAVLPETCPVMIVGGGSRMADGGSDTGFKDTASQQAARHVRTNLAIASLMSALKSEPAPQAADSGPTDLYDPLNGARLEPIPAEVLACNFWLLAAAPNSPHVSDAWFQANGYSLPVVGALKQKVASGSWQEKDETASQGGRRLNDESMWRVENLASSVPASQPAASKPIEHYLLLPLPDQGVSDWHLDVIRPFVKKFHPTVGFSLEEAAHARRVTVVGGPEPACGAVVERLHSAGCTIDLIDGDGTNIATLLAML